VLATAPAGASAPDSITLANGDIWVAYTNGADSTGVSGHSTIVEYDRSGKIDHKYQIAGSVDGLKLDPVTGEIWALQNQDGNSTLTLIDPETHKLAGPFSYAIKSSARGYDDVAFERGKVYLSYTNPVNPGDPTLVQLLNGNDPHGILHTRAILRFGDMGHNLETGNLGVIPQTDPDSLKVAPNGDLLLTGGADQTIVDIHHPGTHHQIVSFTTIVGVSPSAGLDDVIRVNARAGTFYLSDTHDNRVLVVHATHLNVHDYYVSLGDAFGQVDPRTGQFTAIVTAANAPGFEFGSAHGAEFVAAGHVLPDVASAAHELHLHVNTAHDALLFA
jgi:hypothetical protein